MDHRVATPAGWVTRLDHAVAGRLRLYGKPAQFAYEFLCFGIKQAWACLFGGLLVALLLATWRWYPSGMPLARYDFLTLAALAIQLGLLASRLESPAEARVIALFHGVGTLMEVFKTAVGSWTYPGPSLLHLGGVPLFTGFMYAAVGSYIARAWRLFGFAFTGHPPFRPAAMLAGAIYLNFFTHHYVPDARLGLFLALGWLFRRTWVHFRVRRTYRRMPLLLGFGLVALFIWLAENAGTYSRTWLYPAQRHGWSMVPPAKLGAWLLLMVISYVMVWGMHRRQPGLSRTVAANPRRGYTFALTPHPPSRGDDVSEGLHD